MWGAIVRQGLAPARCSSAALPGMRHYLLPIVHHVEIDGRWAMTSNPDDVDDWDSATVLLTPVQC